MSVKDLELDASIEELEAMAFPSTEKEGGDEQPSEVADLKPDEETTQGSEEAKVAPEAAEPKAEVVGEERKTERDWQFDYKKLRTNSDRFKHESRQKILGLEAKVDSLEKYIATNTPKKDIFEGTFSKEEEEMLGDKAVDAIKKASQTASESVRTELQTQVDNERQLRLKAEAQVAERAAKTKATNFFNNLERAVPDYKTVNADPAFEKFMYEADPVNGGPRINYFRAAEQTGNAGVIAGYMKEFKGAVVDPLASRVAPEANATSTTVAKDKEKLWPISEMEQFYEDVNRGKYKGKQTLQDKHQAQWDDRFERGLIDMRM